MFTWRSDGPSAPPAVTRVQIRAALRRPGMEYGYSAALAGSPFDPWYGAGRPEVQAAYEEGRQLAAFALAIGARPAWSRTPRQLEPALVELALRFNADEVRFLEREIICASHAKTY